MLVYYLVLGFRHVLHGLHLLGDPYLEVIELLFLFLYHCFHAIMQSTQRIHMFLQAFDRLVGGTHLLGLAEELRHVIGQGNRVVEFAIDHVRFNIQPIENLTKLNFVGVDSSAG